jgi:DNA-binding MarR family transcriptional regulator
MQGDTPNWHPWLEFFLTALQRQTVHLRIKAEQAIAEATSLSVLDPVDLLIIEHIRQRKRATMANLLEATKANRSTLKAHVKSLVSSERIVQHGTGRGTWYSLP